MFVFLLLHQLLQNQLDLVQVVDVASASHVEKRL